MARTNERRPLPRSGAQKVDETEASITPAGDVLLPVAAAIVGDPLPGRRLTLVVAVDCPHCHGVHRHLTAATRPRELVRPCPVSGRTYVALRHPAKRVIGRG